MLGECGGPERRSQAAGGKLSATDAFDIHARDRRVCAG